MSKRGLFGEDQLGYYFPLGQGSKPPPATAFKQFSEKRYATRYTLGRILMKLQVKKTTENQRVIQSLI